jgi:single-strand DNA-binding protein
MAAAVNNFTLTGNISQPIEIRTTKSGKKFAFISIAVKSGVSDEVDFISFIIWEKLAENVMKYCNKGDAISVLGHISTVKKDGKSELMLTGDMVSFLHKAAKKEETKADPSNDVFETVSSDPFANL